MDEKRSKMSSTQTILLSPSVDDNVKKKNENSNDFQIPNIDITPPPNLAPREKGKDIRGGICRGESGGMGSWSRFGGLTKGCFKSVTPLSPLFLHLNEI